MIILVVLSRNIFIIWKREKNDIYSFGSKTAEFYRFDRCIVERAIVHYWNWLFLIIHWLGTIQHCEMSAEMPIIICCYVFVE